MWLKGIDEVPSVYFTKRERQEALQAQAIAEAQNRPIRRLPQGFSYAWENLKKGNFQPLEALIYSRQNRFLSPAVNGGIFHHIACGAAARPERQRRRDRWNAA